MSDDVRLCAKIRFSKTGPMRFLGHLDLSRAFDRAVRRAGLPAAYSEGFNPRAKISFGPPLPVGAEGLREIAVLDLAEKVAGEDARQALNAALVPGLQVSQVDVVARGRRSPVADLSVAEYQIFPGRPEPPREALCGAVSQVLAAPRVEVQRKTKRTQGQCDIRPAILDLGLEPVSEGVLRMVVGLSEANMARPTEVVAALNARMSPPHQLSVGRLVRTDLR